MKLDKRLEGDQGLWALLIFLGILSFGPVFSASSNLAHTVGNGTPFTHFIKHLVILLFGFGIAFAVHKIPFGSFRKYSPILLLISIGLLVITAFQGTLIGGVQATRWLRIPLLGLSFQVSSVASIALLIYLAHMVTRKNGRYTTFWTSMVFLWLPILIVVGLVLPFDLSTGLLILGVATLLIYLGGYQIWKFLVIGTILISSVLMLYFGDIIHFGETSRLETWKSRIENYVDTSDADNNYQIVRAKAAIASGGIIGVGPGKSRIKSVLPQSSSDFIYAIIVEEYGFVGGVILILAYTFILIRIVVISSSLEDPFQKLLVAGIGIPILIQAFVNIAVSVQLLPVTGLTLPMMSMGGTSLWITCIAFGIILGISANANRKSVLRFSKHKFYTQNV